MAKTKKLINNKSQIVIYLQLEKVVYIVGWNKRTSRHACLVERMTHNQGTHDRHILFDRNHLGIGFDGHLITRTSPNWPGTDSWLTKQHLLLLRCALLTANHSSWGYKQTNQEPFGCVLGWVSFFRDCAWARFSLVGWLTHEVQEATGAGHLLGPRSHHLHGWIDP